MRIIQCLGCKGAKTIPGMGMISRIQCPVCGGKGYEKIYDDPIAELEKNNPKKEENITIIKELEDIPVTKSKTKKK